MLVVSRGKIMRWPMTKEEAMRIATKFVDSRPDLSEGGLGGVLGLFPAEDAVLLPARLRDKNSDAWLVRFCRRAIRQLPHGRPLRQALVHRQRPNVAEPGPLGVRCRAESLHLCQQHADELHGSDRPAVSYTRSRCQFG